MMKKGTKRAALDSTNDNNNRRKRQNGASESNENASYPETLLSFAEGIKTDLFDIFDSGAKSLQKIVTFPFERISFSRNSSASSCNTPEIEDDIIHIKNVTNEPTEDHKQTRRPLRRRSSLNAQKVSDPVRLRCPSMWAEKENKELVVSHPPPPEANCAAAASDSVNKQSSTLKEGERLNLSKLSMMPHLTVREMLPVFR